MNGRADQIERDVQHWRRRRLASPIGTLRAHYDVVVVGSGYGGSVAAARLAERGKRVCILERGRELRAGDYPNTLPKALRELQIDLAGRQMFSPTALYDLRVTPGLSVFVGCGLGGTSLINAGVVLRPDLAVFTERGWPKALSTDPRVLIPYFAKARNGLAAAPYPDGFEELPKVRTLRRVFAALQNPEAQFMPAVPVAVDFPAAPGRDHEGDRTSGGNACTGCGDCVSGCNYDAKATLIKTYLPLARAYGARIFTETRVTTVRKKDVTHPWTINFEYVGSGRERFAGASLSVTAETVVLAAGVLGSTEILLRSRAEEGLRLSDRLGHRFSGNGDVLAFAYNNREPVSAIGFGTRAAFGGGVVPGPCITSAIQWPRRKPRILLEEGVIPGALSPILSLGFVLTRLFGSGQQPDDARMWSISRFLDSLRGGVRSTQTFLAMVRDRGEGTLVLENDRIRLRWRASDPEAVHRELAHMLRRAAAELGGSYLPSPFAPVTVHPLGGCVMGDSPDDGVVNDMGAVFDPTGPSPQRRLHKGLYVCDASIIPTALVTNPLLTITALAERAFAP